MDLTFKADYEQCLARFEAWWHGQIIDRPPVTTYIKRPPPPMPEKTHATLREWWMDVEYALDRAEASMKTATYFAETFPQYWPNLGPEIVGTLFGCELDFNERSSWSRPVATTCRQVLGMKPDFDNVYWQTIRRMTKLSIERGKGRWLTGLSDFHTNADLLASLLDPQEVCLQYADDFEGAKLACEHVTDFFADIYEDCWKLIEPTGQPSTSWLVAPHMGKSYATSCDLICMVSPQVFQEAIRPSLVREMQYLDCNIFHLDGPGALKHLDSLLEIKELNAIQWVYGAGQGTAKDWIDVYKRIQAGGKGIQLLASDYADALAVMEHLRPEGVWITVNTSYTLDEANAFLKTVQKWAGK